MKMQIIKNCIRLILSPVLLAFGLLTTLVLLPFYPFLSGWGKGDGNKMPTHPFLRFLWITLTMYFTGW